MELNLYDIVEYNGNKHRIMDIDSYDEDLDLAGVGIWVDPDLVTLVESFTAPTFEIGDEVFIKPIGCGDREEYSAGWKWEMDKFVNTQSTVIAVDDIARVCKLANGYWFAPYHLENINNYDMI